MIEYLKGQLVLKTAGYIVLEVGGIGYRVFVPTSIQRMLPAVNEETVLYTYLHIREDEFTLYGFSKMEEKEMFTTLLLVSGVGPKLALAILSNLSVSELKRAIILSDIGVLVNISGVGKKTAERIILELKDKLAKGEETSEENVALNQGIPDLRGQAVSALLALGYNLLEAQRAVPVPTPSDKMTVEELIRLGLKELSKI